MGYYEELDHEIDREMGWGGKAGSPRRRPGYWQAILDTARATSPVWRAVKTVFRAIARVVFFPVISPLAYARKLNENGDMVVVKRSLPVRIIDGLLMRMLLTPVILGLFMIVVVYATTHPRQLRAAATPDGLGLYFKRVNLFTDDNLRLTGWYIPAISAEQVAQDPQNALMQKWPGVVLCHGLGATQDQYLGLAQELHSVGFAILMLDTRGQGESDSAAVTYGLRERLDVRAAVKFLQETPYVDESKICVVGHDIAAMAALQATAENPGITAVVADGLWLKFDERAREVFSRPGADDKVLPTEWLGPLYTLVFEIAVRDRTNQLDPEAVLRNIRKQPGLFVVRQGPDFIQQERMLALSGRMGGHHEIFAANDKAGDDTIGKICEFLISSTGWKGPDGHGLEQIQTQLHKHLKTR